MRISLPSFFSLIVLNVMRCAIWYHLYNLKNVKNTHGRVLILVLKLTLFHGYFSRFLNCEMIPNRQRSTNALGVLLRYSEAVVRTCSVKRVFLNISQNLQENNCAGVSFSTKLQADQKRDSGSGNHLPFINKTFSFPKK